MLTYLEEDAALICRCLPKNIARPDDEQFPLFLIYAVLMRAKGTAATLSDVHDAWAAWRTDSAPLHKSLVPFDELDAAAQMDAISAAIQYAQVPFCAPIGLPPGDYLARCYVPLGGMVESYSTVTDIRRPYAADGGPARDADGFEYVATLPVAPRQITARPNLSGGAV